MRSFIILKIFLFIFVCCPAYIYSQQTYLKLNKDAAYRYDKYVYNNTENFHTSVKPYLKNEIDNIDSLDQDFRIKTNTKFLNYILNKDLLYTDKDTFNLILNPVFTSVISNDLNSNTDPYYLSCGLTLNSTYKKFSFLSNLSLVNSVFPVYASEGVDTTGMFPHWGELGNKNGNIYSKLITTGYLSWSPLSLRSDKVGINMQAGIDKNFWGDGYRSLLLSDNSNAYPFLKMSVNVWKIKYIILYSLLKDIDYHVNTDSLINKYATSHLLSWNVAKRFNLYIFETVIWSIGDHQYSRGFDVNYLNPVIFFRPVEFSIGDPSPDNVLMGAGTRIKIRKSSHIYGQVLLDEFNLNEIRKNDGWWGNKYGFQIGVKTYRLFSVKDLFLLCEYNFVRPYVYSHVRSLENYGHYYRPLAHPAGANFKEIVSILRYDHKRFSVTNKLIFIAAGQDSSLASLGNNIYKSYTKRPSDYGHKTLQGVRTDLIFNELKFAFLVNPEYDLSLEAGVRFRSKRSDGLSDTHTLFFFGLRTLLYNNDNDY